VKRVCYSNCPYENFHGECTGAGSLKKGRPHCFEMTDEEFEAEKQAEERYDDDDEYFPQRAAVTIGNMNQT
jgi:hypothetical protein